jgi:hypothetical protein
VTDDTFSVEDLELKSEDIEKLKTNEVKRRPRQKRGFVMMTLAWKNQLYKAHYACTFRVGIELHYLNYKSFYKPFVLTNVAAARIGIDRQAKHRALLELEALGLIAIERRSRKSPLITVLNP